MDRRSSTPERKLHPPPGSSAEPLWGVGAVSARLGIAAPTLRTWDRRYGLGPSRRTGGGHRRYTGTDVARIDLMSRLVDEGVPAAEAATVALSRAEAALRSATGGFRPVDREPSRGAASAVDTVVRAACALDAVTLSRVIGHVLERRGVVSGWTVVVAPALQEIGERWASGRCGVEVEHLLTERVASELRAITRQRRVHRAKTASVVMASAADEQHHLPVVALEAALAERRIASVVFGPRTPPDALEAAVVQRNAQVVFVWRSMQARDAAHHPFNGGGSYRGRLVLLGGRGWDGAAAGDGMARVPDLATAVVRIEAALGD